MTYLMRLCGAVLAGLLYVSSSVYAEDRPRVDTYIKAYSGGEGITLWVLGIGKPEDKEFLLQYVGVNNDWDKKILKAKKINEDRERQSFNFVVSQNNKEYHTVVVRNGRYQIYLPNGENGTYISYDEAKSRQGNSQHFLTDYLRQQGKIKD